MREPLDHQPARWRKHQTRGATPVPHTTVGWDGYHFDGSIDSIPRRLAPPKPSAPTAWTQLFLQNLTMVAIIGGLPTLLVAALVVSGWISAGAVPVHRAADDAENARDAYFDALERSQPALAELSKQGASTRAVEEVFFVFLDSPRAQRPENADALLRLLDTTAGPEQRAGRGDIVRELLQPVHIRRAEVVEAVAEWDAAVQPWGASLAVALNLAPAPDASFQRYDAGATPQRR